MSEAKLKPCPLCGSTNIRMLEPDLLDTDAWNCAIECLDCQVHIGPSYCEPDPVTARYSAQVDWNRRPSAKSHADEREQFLMANLLAALEVALGNVAALDIVDRVRQVADRIYPTSNLSPVPQAWLDVQAERLHSVPEWTSSKPAVEGAYWVRGNGLVEPFVVLVKLDQGELWCNLHMRNTDTNFGYGYAVDDLSSEFEWCGPLAAATGKSVPQAWLDVQAERRRQVEAENWTPEHDDQHSDGQMAQAAGCYALHAGGIGTDWPGGIRNGSALFWPWDEEWWKPKSARENLVRAGALVLAEIERLDRSATEQGSTCCKGSA